MTARATVGGCAVGLASGWNVANVGAAPQSLADAYGVALAVVGLFATAAFVTHAALQIPAGRRVDRYGAKRVAFVALAILAAANGIACIAPEPWIVVAARALSGVGTALAFVAGIDYVREQTRSPFLAGLYGGVALGGAGLALAVVPALLGPLDWRSPFVTGAVLAPVAALLLALGPADRPRHEAPRRSAGLRALLADRRLYRIAVLYSASLGLAILAGNWVTTLLTRAGGLSETQAGVAGASVLVASIVGRPLGGWIARGHPEATKTAVAASLAASAVSTAVLAAAEPLWLASGAAVVLGLASGIPFAASFGAAAHLRPDQPAAAVGLVNMVANAVIVVGTPLVGLTFSLPGEGRIGFLALAALWAAALLALPSARDLAVR